MPVIQDDIGVKAVAYLAVKQQEKDAKKTIDKLRVDLEGYLVANGVVDDKGNKLVVVKHAGVSVQLKHELRTSVIQNGDALITLKKLLKKKNLTTDKIIETRVIETMEVIRQDVLEVMVNDGLISESDVAKMFSKAETKAFKVTKL